MRPRRVVVAQAYDQYQLRALGSAVNMYVRQFQFPYEYDERDAWLAADIDRLSVLDRRRVMACIERQTGNVDATLADWVRRAYDNKIMYFLTELLQADAGVAWTGYRVLGTVQRVTRRLAWTVELFAKHPESATRVYTGPDAPNVEPSPPQEAHRDPYHR